jgi:hypothetical protein
MNKLFIAAAGALLLAGCEKRPENNTETVGDTTQGTVTTENAEVPDQQCYLQVTTGDRKNLSDSIIFNIEKRVGDSIWGIYHWKPAEKDKKISTFKGTLKGSEGHAIANSNAEGMNYNEEVIFALKDNKLAVKFGEMAEGKDGVWYYKDKAKLSEQVLDKVDCK